MNATRYSLLLAMTLATALACTDDGGGEGAPAADAGQGEGSGTAATTWSTHIAPLMHENCTGCHTQGGAAPLPLDSFESLELYGSLALDAMESGRMPPWQPDAECHPIEGERRLAADDIDAFRGWLEDGMPRGPERPALERASTSFDATHEFTVEPYTPSFGASDDYRCFLFDVEFDEPMYLLSSNVRPGNSIVHHVLVYALTGDQAEEARARESAEEGPGYTCFGGPVSFGGVRGDDLELGQLSEVLRSVRFPQQLGAWVPAQTPKPIDPSIGTRVDAGSLLVMQVHYSAVAGAPMLDSETTFEAHLTADEPEWLTRTAPVLQQNLDIPAGEPAVEQSALVPYYGDELILDGVTGHMHLLGSRLYAEIRRAPDTSGEGECALHLPDWDFNWQESYYFPEGQELTLENGDAFYLSCTYDNSAANQPVVNGVQQAPRDVQWGEDTLDEMCLLYIHTVEPFEPPPAPGAAACPSSCVEACEGDIACLNTCDGRDLSCFGCVLDESAGCGGLSCLASLAADRECFARCINSTVLIGGNVGLCFESECADSYAEASACLSTALAADECAAARTACGL